jgi:DNA-binding response OmpR family regulator
MNTVSAAADPPAHVLVVDDDTQMRDMIAEYLAAYEFRVSGAADGNAMRIALAASVVDLVVLDLRLRGEDGMHLARTLRSESSIPIMMLTASRDEVDRIMGLELGADDYLTKPVNLRELLARIRTVLRRTRAQLARTDHAPGVRAYRFSGWELDLRTRRLASAAGEQVELTNGEFGLLTALLRAPGRVLSRDQLLDMSKGYDDTVSDRSIDVQILRLRRKLEPDPARPTLIRTERGAGYLLDTSVTRI